MDLYRSSLGGCSMGVDLLFVVIQSALPCFRVLVVDGVLSQAARAASLCLCRRCCSFAGASGVLWFLLM